ncbi:DUF1566 domain-containing protein [uncultured Thiodictyon sp.]|uniref:Lcl C-terminal domain-containing protein n=1 Tax=uncultured Thiodictyon sp. TaxID=1846217 RepID=UPI0025FECEB5|nr:DUF1566 domain-containing protein [uncultured Thiodictyon sp.]
MKNMRDIYLVGIALFIFFAVFSCKSKSKIELLAEKYHVSEETVSECLADFSDTTEEKVLSIVSKEQWFFGFFGPTCKELADQSRLYNSPAVFFDARMLKMTKDRYIDYKAKEIAEKAGVSNSQAREWLQHSQIPFDASLSDDVIWYFCKSDWTSCQNTNSISKQLTFIYLRDSDAITSDAAAEWIYSSYPTKMTTAYHFLIAKAQNIVFFDGVIGTGLFLTDALKPFAIDMVICADKKYSLLAESPISSVLEDCFKNAFSSLRDSLVSAKRIYEQERQEKPMTQYCDYKKVSATAPASRFIDNGDGTVTDKETKLQWKRCSQGQYWSGDTCIGTGYGTSYQDAVSIAYQARYAGKDDWRTPEIWELGSIVELACAMPSIDAAIFPGTSAGEYQTTGSDSIDFREGILTNRRIGLKERQIKLRLVRGREVTPVCVMSKLMAIWDQLGYDIHHFRSKSRAPLSRWPDQDACNKLLILP